MASATVTVARMIGMAVGLAILTAYGSTTIDRLYEQVYATPDAYLQYIPEELRGRPLKDRLVVDALETWAAARPRRSWSGMFLVAAAVTAARSRRRSCWAGGRVCWRASRAWAGAGGPDPDGHDPSEPGADS